MDKLITLKLRNYGRYQKTQRGILLFMEHGFCVFVPNTLLKKVRT